MSVVRTGSRTNADATATTGTTACGTAQYVDTDSATRPTTVNRTAAAAKGSTASTPNSTADTGGYVNGSQNGKSDVYSGTPCSHDEPPARYTFRSVSAPGTATAYQTTTVTTTTSRNSHQRFMT